MIVHKALSILALCTYSNLPYVTSQSQDETTTDDPNQCGLYLAPSTSNNNHDDTSSASNNPTRLGMFAGKDYPPHTTIGIPDVALPLTDMDLHNGRPKGYVPEGYFTKQSSFFWQPRTVGATYESIVFPKGSDEVRYGGGGVDVAIPGVGSLGDDHSGLTNVRWDGRSVLYRSFVGLDSEDDGNDMQQQPLDPARGSYTPYFNVTLQTTKSIPIGMQIFQNLGESDRYDYTKPQTLKPVDYEDADDLLTKIQSFLTTHHHQLTDVQRRTEVYQFFVKDILKIVGTKGWNDDKKRNDNNGFLDAILNLFPEHVDDIQSLLDRGGTFVKANPHTVRDIHWLQTEGQCLDNITPKTSTIPHAGHGAFATRNIPTGGLVAPAPLIIIDTVSWFDMYRTKLEPSMTNERRMYVTRASGNKIVHKQLMLNYCFRHPESSLLFFSYGMGVNYINHQSSSSSNEEQGGEKGRANAKIVWTKKSYHKTHLHNLTTKQLLKDPQSFLGLGFDIVATRNIQAGEEIFIDYGTEWTDSWTSHVNGKRFPRSWPDRALDLNHRLKGTTLYTVKEREEMVKKSGGTPDPYDDSLVMTACYYKHEVLPETDESPRRIDGFNVYRFPDGVDLIDTVINLHVCRIMDRVVNVVDDETDGTESYTVFFPQEGDKGNVIVKGLPREAIAFVDRPFKGDIHVPKTFRSPIGIPDEIFPEAWKDLK